MRKKIVAGNWKMNASKVAAERLVGGIIAGLPNPSPCQWVMIPPYPYLGCVDSAIQGHDIALGAQDTSNEQAGAFTGEVSADMLRDMGCQYVLVGHSERRSLYGESSELVAQKFAAAKRAGLIPILCVGESLQQREQEQTEQVVCQQLDAVLFLGENFENAVVAYEPVWAIGTGKTASPEQAQGVHHMIRQYLSDKSQKSIAESLSILYGGSVKGDNAGDLFAMPDIDGGLIGGASLKADDFLAIGRSFIDQGVKA